MHKPRTITTTEGSWQGMALSVTFEADFLNMSRHSGFATAHLQIRASQRLPITETGYRSHFLPLVEIDEAGGPVAYALAWLDLAAADPEWKAYQNAQRQLSLFND